MDCQLLKNRMFHVKHSAAQRTKIKQTLLVFEFAQNIANPVQIVFIIVIDIYAPLAVVPQDRHFCGKHALQTINHVLKFNALLRGLRFFFDRCGLFDKYFKIAHGNSALNGFRRQIKLQRRIRNGHETARMSRRKLVFLD